MEKDYSKLVDIAFDMHKNGKFIDAKLVCEKILSLYPEDINVLNLYAQLNFSLKNYDVSFDLFKKIYEKTNLDEIASKIALSAYFLKKYQVAIDYYKKTPNIKNDFSSNFYISICYKELEDYNNSIKYALNAYSLKKDNLDLCLLLSFLYETTNKLDEAIIYLNNSLKISYNEKILYNLGVLYKKQNQSEDAISCFEKVLELDPNNKNAMLNIASIYRNINLLDALEIYKEIEQIFPNDTQIKFFIYSIYFEMLDFNNALNIALNLIQQDPDNIEYYKLAGDSYYSLYEYEKALEIYKRAEAIDTKNQSILMRIAEIYYVYGNFDKALEYVHLAGLTIQNFIDLSLKKREFEPIIEQFTQLHIHKKGSNDGITKAKRMFYKLGIEKKFNVREEVFLNQKKAVDNSEELILSEFYKKNPTLNDDLSNKRILIYSVHGIGDFIIFSRYIYCLKEVAKSIILYIPKSLERIVKYNFPFIKVYINGQIVPSDEYDYAFSTFVLLSFTTKNLKQIPYSNSYMSIPENIVVSKSKFLQSSNNKKKIGLFWQGNPTILLNRSIKLKYFLPLLEDDKFQFYSFQISKIDDDSEALKKKLPIIDLAEKIDDYFDTAAFLKNIDLLITIDSSIANLAGALGVKTYLLLPFDSEWRWFNDDSTTPWYDSVRIFKQKYPNNWDEVVLRIKNEL